MAAVPAAGRADRISTPPAAAAAAASELFERYRARIYVYCLHQLRSREEAEDATQTTFMNAFRGLERGVVPESEQAWLFKIAENVCLSHRRTSWRRGRVESPSDFEQLQEVVPSAPHDLGDELIGLQEALEAMPENQRRAILLREWQGLSYREVAAELELSQSAVETLIFRARRTLATGLEQPLAAKKRRRVLVGGLNLGSLLAALKELIAGSAATKAVAVAVAATSTTIAATSLPDRSTELDARASASHRVQPREQPAATAAADVREEVAARRPEPASAPVKPKRQRQAPASTPRPVERAAAAEPVAATPVEQPAIAEARPPEPVRALQSKTPAKERAGSEKAKRRAEPGPPPDKGPPAGRGKEDKPATAGPPADKPLDETGAAHGPPGDTPRGNDKEKHQSK